MRSSRSAGRTAPRTIGDSDWLGLAKRRSTGDTLPMTTAHSIALRGIWIASISTSLALIASCQRSSLPPLADDAEVARTQEWAGEPLVIGEAVPRQIESRTIAIDGGFDDWADLPAVAIGHSTYDGSPYVRLGRVWTTYDSQWVYFRIELGRLVNVQGLTGTLSLQLDADGNRLTGDIRTGGTGEVGIAGVDFELNFSPRGANGGFGGVGAEVIEAGLPTAPANPYWFGASFAPTYASTQIELRLARGGLIPGATVMPFVSSVFSARLTFTDEVGSIIDRTEPFSIALPALASPDLPQREMKAEDSALAPSDASMQATRDAATPETEPSDAVAETSVPPEPASEMMAAATSPASRRLARGDRRDVRAVTWNVLNGSLFTNPEPVQRILRALDPDIICFQELGKDASEGVLRSWLDKHLPTTFGWEVMISEDGDVGVASRLSAVSVTKISGADAADAPPLRAASLLVAAAGRRILVTSVHFKCCGRAGDRNDQKRVAEANAVRRLLRGAQFDLTPSGLLIMGDLNLVGSDEPLEIVRFQNDLNATNLLVANPFVRGDATNTTWRDPKQPFLPARLDYAFISDAVLRVSQSFVLDTDRLSKSELNRLRLLPEDSAVSDHLPVVVDFH